MTKIILVAPWVKFVKKASDEGLEVISLWSKESGAENLLNQVIQSSNESYIFDINDEKELRKILELITLTEKVDYIYHIGREETMISTYRFAEEKNISLNSAKTIQYMNNKHLTRDILNRNNLSEVLYQKVNDIKTENFNDSDIHFPIIIKPTNLSGSKGVYLCKSDSDLHSYRSNAEFDCEYIIEEFLEGSEVSVETITYKGKHRIIGVTDKIKGKLPYFVEMGHIFPSQLEKNTIQKIEQVVIDFLNLVDYQFGPAHTEVIVTKKGPKIVESQARLGGDQIPTLINLSYGIDIEREIFKLLNNNPIEEKTVLRRISSIQYFEGTPGKIISIEGIDKIKKLEYVKKVFFDLEIGMTISPITDSRSRYGYYIVEATSKNELYKRIKKINATVEIMTDNS